MVILSKCDRCWRQAKKGTIEARVSRAGKKRLPLRVRNVMQTDTETIMHNAERDKNGVQSQREAHRRRVGKKLIEIEFCVFASDTEVQG